MRVNSFLASFFLLLSTPAFSAAPSSEKLSWAGAIPAAAATSQLFQSSDILILGEGHGHMGGLAFYKTFFKESLHEANAVFLEWIYKVNQPLLENYLRDKNAPAGSAHEAFYFCRLARMGLRAHPENAKLSEEKFNVKFAKELGKPAELADACDYHDGMAETLRALKKQTEANPELKVCAIDFDDRTQPAIPYSELAEPLMGLRNNARFASFFEQKEKADRELVLASNILSCLQGRTKAVGIVGAAHAFSGLATGMIREILGSSKRISVVSQITPSKESAVSEEEDCGCLLDNKELRAQLFELKDSLALRTKNLTPDQRKYIKAKDDGEALQTDLLVFHRPAIQRGDALSPSAQKLVEKYFTPR